MGDGAVNDAEFQIDGRSGTLKNIFDRRQPYPLDLNLEFADLALSLSGTVADYEDGAGLDLLLAVKGQDLTQLLELFQADFQISEQLNLNARLSGDLTPPRLSDMDLKVDVRAEQSTILSKFYGVPIEEIGRVSISGRVTGATDRFRLEDIRIEAGKADKVQIKWRGRVGKSPLGDDRPVSDVQTFGSLQAVRSSDLAALFGFELANIGPVRATWRETDRRGRNWLPLCPASWALPSKTARFSVALK